MRLAGNIGRCDGTVPVDAWDEQGPAEHQAGNLDDISGTELGVGRFRDLEAVSFQEGERNQAVGRPSDDYPVSRPEVVRGEDVPFGDEVGAVFGVKAFAESFEIFVSGVARQDVQRRKPRGGLAGDVPPDALERRSSETATEFIFDGCGEPLEAGGCPHRLLEPLLHGLQERLQFGNGFHAGKNINNPADLQKNAADQAWTLTLGPSLRAVFVSKSGRFCQISISLPGL